MDNLLKSTDAARLLGVAPSTIKRWADEGRLPHVKTAGGHRRFRQSDVAAFSSGEPDAASAWANVLLRSQNPFSLRSELLSLRARTNSWCEAADEIGGALAEIGLRWRRGELSIHEEHLATENLKRGVASCADAIPIARDARRCVLVVAEGDEHTLGLSLLEVCLRELGWSTPWLGRQTPLKTLVSFVAATSPDAVAISASAFSQNPESLRHIAAVLSDACKASSTSLILGGSGSWPTDLKHGHRLTSFQELGLLTI
ncbi:MAG: helix-turn-helix domain-containing protein [Myxococcota bacterium]|nr:helix-turn-helix domain-containing protein [Myxococcota bacterium]